MNILQTINKALYEKEAKYKTVSKEKKVADTKRVYFIQRTETLQEVLAVFQTAIKQTQELLATNIASVVTLALSSLFSDPYEFIVDFVPRRNSTECDLLFERNEERMVPLKECGYGAVDTAAMAMRVAIWGMEEDVAPIIILDEPFRNLDRNKLDLASAMVKSLSEDLGIQFIIVTHAKQLMGHADKTFEVIMNNKISTVKEIEGKI